jgi:hypothetical protein
MIPKNISFTGLEISPTDLWMRRVHPGPYPASWRRWSFDCDKEEVQTITLWLLDAINGRFGVQKTKGRAIVFFEDEGDAVTFRLRDGDRVLNEGQE